MFENFENNLYMTLNNHFIKDCSDSYRNLLDIEPHNSLLIYLLSHSLFLKNDFKNSDLYFNKAKGLNSNIEFKDDFSNINEIMHLVYNTICSQENPYKLEVEEKALNISSVYESTYINISNSYLNNNDLSNAIRICKKGLEKYSDSDDLKFNLSAAYLKSRELQYAWEGYETRINLFKHHGLIFKNVPKFDFQNDNPKVCVFATSASENTILFARFLPMLKMHGVSVISKPQKSLVSLFKSSKLDAQIEDVSECDIDFQIPFMSLASIFKISHSTMYNNATYIISDKKLVNYYRYKLLNIPQSSIGIVWGSNESPAKSIELEKFIPFFKKMNFAKLYSLQPNVTPQEQEILDYYNIDNLGKYYNDFSDVAALIDNMNYVVGCDTAVTNLSCAMGKKTYVLLPYVSDWRWGLYEEKTDWYSSAILLRQKNKGDWDEVVSRLTGKLFYFPQPISV